jgi:hypothetical protein
MQWMHKHSPSAGGYAVGGLGASGLHYEGVAAAGGAAVAGGIDHARFVAVLPIVQPKGRTK